MPLHVKNVFKSLNLGYSLYISSSNFAIVSCSLATIAWSISELTDLNLIANPHLLPGLLDWLIFEFIWFVNLCISSSFWLIIESFCLIISFLACNSFFKFKISKFNLFCSLLILDWDNKKSFILLESYYKIIN